MKNLLDTHSFLWFFNDDCNLSNNAKDAILNPENENFVSIVSIWELAIKMSIKKYFFDGGMPALIKTIKNNNFTILRSIKEEYVKIVKDLPFHHKDPFDRMIIATAIHEKMTLITADENIMQYNEVNKLW